MHLEDLKRGMINEKLIYEVDPNKDNQANNFVSHVEAFRCALLLLDLEFHYYQQDQCVNNKNIRMNTCYQNLSIEATAPTYKGFPMPLYF